MKKEMPAPTAARKAIHETTFGLTRSSREATGTRNQSAALRYRSSTTRAPPGPNRRTRVRGLPFPPPNREGPLGGFGPSSIWRFNPENQGKAKGRLPDGHFQPP